MGFPGNDLVRFLTHHSHDVRNGWREDGRKFVLSII